MVRILVQICLLPALNNFQTFQVDHTNAIKEYSRSSADQEEPLPHDLRPLPVLCMTMNYLVTKILDQNSETNRDWYDFVWNRTRGIRKVTLSSDIWLAKQLNSRLHCLVLPW